MDMSVNEDSSAAFTSVLSRLHLLALLESIDILIQYKYSCRAASRLAGVRTELKIAYSITSPTYTYVHSGDLQPWPKLLGHKGNKPIKMTYFLPPPPPDATLMSGIQVILG